MFEGADGGPNRLTPLTLELGKDSKRRAAINAKTIETYERALVILDEHRIKVPRELGPLGEPSWKDHWKDIEPEGDWDGSASRGKNNRRRAQYVRKL